VIRRTAPGRAIAEIAAGLTGPVEQKEHAMAKGQMKSNKEKKKPKAAHNQKKKGGQVPMSAGSQPMPGFMPGGKK
jgi:hypothetical protein